MLYNLEYITIFDISTSGIGLYNFKGLKHNKRFLSQSQRGLAIEYFYNNINTFQIKSRLTTSALSRHRENCA